MFKLLRRVSSSIYPRPDRPWSDDATSNAPSIGRKRRMNDEDADSEESGSTRKRRGQLERQDTSELGELGAKDVKGSEVDPDVKQVTRGVKEVELEDKKKEGSGKDDEKGVTEEASKTIDGESCTAAPLDSAHATQNDDGPSQDVTVTKDEVPAGQSEAIAEAPSNDSPEVEEPTSTEPPVPAQAEENEASDVTPEARSDEVAGARECVEFSPEP